MATMSCLGHDRPSPNGRYDLPEAARGGGLKKALNTSAILLPRPACGERVGVRGSLRWDPKQLEREWVVAAIRDYRLPIGGDRAIRPTYSNCGDSPSPRPSPRTRGEGDYRPSRGNSIFDTPH